MPSLRIYLAREKKSLHCLNSIKKNQECRNLNPDVSPWPWSANQGQPTALFGSAICSLTNSNPAVRLRRGWEGRSGAWGGCDNHATPGWQTVQLQRRERSPRDIESPAHSRPVSSRPSKWGLRCWEVPEPSVTDHPSTHLLHFYRHSCVFLTVSGLEKEGHKSGAGNGIFPSQEGGFAPKAWRAAVLCLPGSHWWAEWSRAAGWPQCGPLGAAVGSGPAAAAAGCSPLSGSGFPRGGLQPRSRGSSSETAAGTPGACGEATQGGKGATSEALRSLAKAETWGLCSVCRASGLIRIYKLRWSQKQNECTHISVFLNWGPCYKYKVLWTGPEKQQNFTSLKAS